MDTHIIQYNNKVAQTYDIKGVQATVLSKM